MLTVPGGMERTAEEYTALLEAASFRLTRIVPTASAVRVVFQKWRWPCLHRPSKGIAVDKQANDDVVHLYRFDKQMVLRTKRFMRVRKVRCLRSICCVFRLPGLCTSGSRCRVYAPQ